jgi:hypothetical protein
MLNETGELMDAPIQPEIVSEPPRSDRPKPWGFWATIGFSLVVVLVMTAVQTVTVIGFMAVRGHLYPQRSWALLAQDAQTSGLLLSMSVWACLPFSLGLTLLFARLRPGWTVGEYLALKPVPHRTMRAVDLIPPPLGLPQRCEGLATRNATSLRWG